MSTNVSKQKREDLLAKLLQKSVNVAKRLDLFTLL